MSSGYSPLKEVTMLCVGRCGYNRFTTCEAQGSQDAIKTQCEMQKSCVLAASSALFGNPCNVVTKYAVMNYRCVPFGKFFFLKLINYALLRSVAGVWCRHCNFLRIVR